MCNVESGNINSGGDAHESARACIGLSVRGVEGRMSKEGLEVVIGERGERLAAALSRRCGHVEWGSGQCSRCARGRGRCG